MQKAKGTRNGKSIGRPRREFDHEQVRQLRQNGLAIDAIARQMKLGVGTVLKGAPEPASVIR